MPNLLHLVLAMSLGFAPASVSADPPVRVLSVPENGLQPQVAVATDGTLHLVYYKGKPRTGDLFYVTRERGHEDFSSPVRVNSEPGTAVAMGTIRGAQMAPGRAGRIHVAWNGAPVGAADKAHGTHPECPMLCTRLDPATGVFEPQRNLMTITSVLDGGGSVAADQQGNVWVVWHGAAAGTAEHGESSRRVYMAKSSDDGATFAPEVPVDTNLGACACCALTSVADSHGALSIFYRAARDSLERDMVLLRADKPDSATASIIDRWQVQTCPMSSCALVADGARDTTVLAWETKGQVYFCVASRSDGKPGPVTAAPGPSTVRKHPRLATNGQGDVLLVWTEGAGWDRGGSIAWQIFDPSGRPKPDAGGRADDLPPWSFAAAACLPDGSFVVLR